MLRPNDHHRAATVLRIPPESFPLVFGHRGFASQAPENTLPAFELAARHGVPAVEFDVQGSVDGEVVVVHDHDLGRLAGIEARVEELTARELAAAEVGGRFGAAFAGAGVPTLQQVVGCLPPTTILDIEIKVHHPQVLRLATMVARAVGQLQIADRTVVSSFHPGVLWHLARLLPKVPRAMIYSRHQEVPWYLRRGWGGIAVGAQLYKPHYPLVSTRQCARVPVLTWTVNDQKTALQLLQAGVAGLCGDDPVLLMDAVARYKTGYRVQQTD